MNFRRNRGGSNWLRFGKGLQLFAVSLGLGSACTLVAQDPTLPFVPPSPVKTSRATQKKLPIQPSQEMRQAAAVSTLPDVPAASQIMLFPGLPDPLRPVEDASDDSSTAALAASLNAWTARQSLDDFGSLEAFVAQHPA